MAGGFSGERDISIQSARTIASHLDPALYEVYTIEVSLQDWLYHHSGNSISVDKNDFSLNMDGGKVAFDAAFIAIHGTPGEDGKLQGYFDMLGVPYNTCGAITSALTFNKWFCNQVVRTLDVVQVSKGVHVVQSHVPDLAKLASWLAFPVFVKPNEGGSSIGMSKVSDPSRLAEALDKAFREDDQVLIEEFVKGREFTCGVFEHQSRLQVLPITEIRSTKDFFDYEAKYTPGKSQEITPAPIPDALADRIGDTARKIFRALNCRGLVRIDFIYSEQGDSLYFLEVNTMPGQSENSIVPQQVRAKGLTLKTFYGWLIEDTLARNRQDDDGSPFQ